MKTYKIIFLAYIFSVGLIGCKETKDHEHEEHEEHEEVLPENIVEMRDDQKLLASIEIASLQTRSLASGLKASGVVSVAPQNKAAVCMPMGGFIKSTSLMPGNVVSKGQTLALIESQDFIDIQQDYLEARNKLQFSEAEYQRHKQLFDEEIYSQENMQQVTSDYKSLKAKVKGLEQKLLLLNINPERLNEDNISSTIQLVSPITGYIKSVNVNIGKYISPTDVLFEIMNSENLFLELTLFEKDADQVKVGQKIHFFVNNETEQHDGHIYQTGKSVNDDKTLTVFASVDSRCKNVLPGMYVNASIETVADRGIAIASEAVVSFDDKDYIFIFEKDKEEDGKPFSEYRMVQVIKGITDQGYTQIELPQNYDISKVKVVVKGAYNLLSAMKNAGEMAC